MLRKQDWRGCAEAVDVCNAIEKRRANKKRKIAHKAEKLIALSMAIRSLTCQQSKIQKEVDNLRAMERVDGQAYKEAYDSLRKKHGSVKRKNRQKERDKIIKKLNL